MTPNTQEHALPIPTCSQCQAIGCAMPPLYVAMEQALGVDVFLNFVSKYGGREITIPTYKRIGSETHPALRWLAEEVGWGKLVVPVGPIGRRARVRFAVYQALRDGQSLSQIAQKHAMHVRSIAGIKRRLVEAGALTATTTKKDLS